MGLNETYNRFRASKLLFVIYTL